jgi:PadR family transcriptional regulator PadR
MFWDRLDQGTLSPMRLGLEQEGLIALRMGRFSGNNRRARFYGLTRGGRMQLQTGTQDWPQTAAIIERFFGLKPEELS